MDILIVGQGLAGSLLAWTLKQSGLTIHIIDDQCPNAASRVAAGLVNPVTGRRLVKTWNLETFYPHALRLYGEFEATLSRPFYIAKDLIQLFNSDAQRQAWNKRRQEHLYQDWCGSYLEPGGSAYPLHDEFGAYLQNRSGYVEIADLLQSLQHYFASLQCLSEQAFEYGQLQLGDHCANWQGVRAKRVVFCEGHKVKANPWFGTVGMNLVKGEILTIRTETELSHHIINNGQWILPISQTRYKIGATYDRNLDLRVSNKAKHDLLNVIPQIFTKPVEHTVLRHQVGIRPATIDRKPILGSHPQYAQLNIFNGFGSKGSLMIPYAAKLMCEFLNQEASIPADMDVKRFF